MTAPRVPLFQRKGGASPASGTPGGKPEGVTISINHGKPSEEGNAAAPDDGSQDATCPSCGCTFDPATGDVKDSPDSGGPPDAGGGDLSSKIAAMMGGGGDAQQ